VGKKKKKKRQYADYIEYLETAVASENFKKNDPEGWEKAKSKLKRLKTVKKILNK
jgi:hypothetical protein